MNDKIENSSQSSTPVQEQKISLYEKHKKVYIRPVKGWWATWRWIFVFGTQLLFYGLPWLQWNDRQAVLFHLVERKFYFFGLVFWPQDAFYLAILLIISAYGLFLFTAVAGRLFCGYACPQTVYTEIFMWIETRIEGNRSEQIKLDKGPMTGRKLGLKVTKHTLWILFSLWTGFTLVGYFTPMHELLASIPTFSFGGWEIFWIFFYAGFAYMMAGFLREQVCKYMCPYARFQSVMFDPDTLIITYDAERGEPRGIRKKNTDVSAQGDCVACNICVHVCPVGIDIRDGLQYECIGCGACIDGCDEVMDKVGLPRGLIRYTSENALAKKTDRTGLMSHIIRPRILVYSAILAVICVAAAWSITTRIPLRADVLRDRSVLAREAEDGRIENVYTLKVMNVFEKPRNFKISATGLDGLELVPVTRVEAGPAENVEVILSLRVPYGSVPEGTYKVYFDVVAEDDPAVAVHEKTTFIMP